jgi:hypothetical protein
MPRKDSLSPREQRARFAKAFDTYQHYLDTENYLAAYVVAFSILEDRVNAMYLTCYHAVTGRAATAEDAVRLGFGYKLKYLLANGVIGVEEKEAWSNLANDRNSKFHAAMWRLDEFQKEHAEGVLECVRKADGARRAQKSRLAAARKASGNSPAPPEEVNGAGEDAGGKPNGCGP